MAEFNWKCPYCNNATTITDPNYSQSLRRISTTKSKDGCLVLREISIACPNPQCRELTLTVSLFSSKFHEDSFRVVPAKAGSLIRTWNLLPQSRSKPQPDYIPEQIRQDYLEACLISNDSPKASAALSRRCLQGIVRDYWEIPIKNRGKLGAELKFIKERVNEDTWEAIQTIRSVGDIGAHMEKDVNFIVDVEPSEAELLLELIETLLEDWYVTSHKRKERAAKTKALAEKKLGEKRAAAKTKPAAEITED